MLSIQEQIELNSIYVGDCIVWAGTVRSKGYGVITYMENGKKITRAAHVVIYELRHGPVPDGCELDHLCRVPRCVNDGHVEPVTHAENIRRGKLCITECPQGHPYSFDNTTFSSTASGYERHCRTCNRERQRIRRGMNHHETEASI